MRPAARVATSATALLIVAAAVLVVVRPGCAPEAVAPRPGELIEVATSDDALWTGIAVTPQGRKFVCHPRWVGPHEDSVVELFADGRRRGFPDRDSNAWRPGAEIPLPKNAWVCAQALRADGEQLWLLDSGNPTFRKPVEHATKLAQVDVITRRFRQWIFFPPGVLESTSYLNDFCVDPSHTVAYVSDSGAGAILVADTDRRSVRRLLAGHPSTMAEEGVVPRVGGVELRYGPGPARDAGAPPMRIHVSALALDASGEWLYWQALVGKTLWRIPTAVLRDASLPPERVAAAVERVGETVVADGLAMDSDGNLYLAAIEKDAIVVRRPDGTLETLVSDPRLAWPHGLALGPDRTLYVTTSQIHRTPLTYPNTSMPSEPFRLFVTAQAPRKR